MCHARRNIIFKIMNYACYGTRYIAKIWNILKIRRKGVKVLCWTMSLTWYTKSVKCIENREKKVCYGGHYIIPQSQFWHLATQLSTTNEHFISDLDFPNSHYIFINLQSLFDCTFQSNEWLKIMCIEIHKFEEKEEENIALIWVG